MNQADPEPPSGPSGPPYAPAPSCLPSRPLHWLDPSWPQQQVGLGLPPLPSGPLAAHSMHVKLEQVAVPPAVHSDARDEPRGSGSTTRLGEATAWEEELQTGLLPKLEPPTTSGTGPGAAFLDQGWMQFQHDVPASRLHQPKRARSSNSSDVPATISYLPASPAAPAPLQATQAAAATKEPRDFYTQTLQLLSVPPADPPAPPTLPAPSRAVSPAAVGLISAFAAAGRPSHPSVTSPSHSLLLDLTLGAAHPHPLDCGHLLPSFLMPDLDLAGGLDSLWGSPAAPSSQAKLVGGPGPRHVFSPADALLLPSGHTPRSTPRGGASLGPDLLPPHPAGDLGSTPPDEVFSSCPPRHASSACSSHTSPQPPSPRAASTERQRQLLRRGQQESGLQSVLSLVTAIRTTRSSSLPLPLPPAPQPALHTQPSCSHEVQAEAGAAPQPSCSQGSQGSAAKRTREGRQGVAEEEQGGRHSPAKHHKPAAATTSTPSTAAPSHTSHTCLGAGAAACSTSSLSLPNTASLPCLPARESRTSGATGEGLAAGLSRSGSVLLPPAPCPALAPLAPSSCLLSRQGSDQLADSSGCASAATATCPPGAALSPPGSFNPAGRTQPPCTRHTRMGQASGTAAACLPPPPSAPAQTALAPPLPSTTLVLPQLPSAGPTNFFNCFNYPSTTCTGVDMEGVEGALSPLSMAGCDVAAFFQSPQAATPLYPRSAFACSPSPLACFSTGLSPFSSPMGRGPLTLPCLVAELGGLTGAAGRLPHGLLLTERERCLGAAQLLCLPHSPLATA
ncbi:hypothetical protein V8C86DRAFT_2761731 [Haematococcus lacustris]